MADPFVVFVVALAGAAIGAYVGAYLREKGKNLATHEDIDRLVRKTEDIKAEVSGDLWEKQNRWTFKRDVYVRLLTGLGDAGSAIRHLVYLHERLPRDAGPDSPAAAKMEPYFEALRKAMVEIRQSAFIVPVVCGKATQEALDSLLTRWLDAEARGGGSYLEGTRTADLPGDFRTS